MVNDYDIVEEANFYLDNDYTIEQTADELGIGKSTLQKHFQKLKEIDYDLYMQVRAKKGNKKEVKTTNTFYSYEYVNKIADLFISNEYTLEELSKSTNMSKSALYNILKSDLIDNKKKDEIDAILTANQKHISVDDLNKYNKGNR